MDELKNAVRIDASKRYFRKKLASIIPSVAFSAGMGFPNAYKHSRENYNRMITDFDRALLETQPVELMVPPKIAGDVTHFTTSTGQRRVGYYGNGGGGGGNKSGDEFKQKLILSAASPLLKGLVETVMQHWLPPHQQFGEKKDPLHMLGSGAIEAFGKGMGQAGSNLLTDIASKAQAAAGSALDNSARKAIIQQLKREDTVLSDATDKDLMEAYHTMVRFAPKLSTDKNAVRSFLRQAVMSGTGPDYATIKSLAETERAITGGDKKK